MHPIRPESALIASALFFSSATAAVDRLYFEVEVSPDGRRMALIEDVRESGTNGHRLRRNLMVANIDGTNAAVVDSVPSSTGTLSDVSWSPDGQVLTYIRVRADADEKSMWRNRAEYRIRVLNADGSAGRTVLRSPTILSGPVFAHDGQRIVYTHTADAGRTLRIIGLDGTGDTEIVRAEVDPGEATRAERGEYLLFNADAVNPDGSLNPAETRRIIAGVKADGTGLAQVLAWPGSDPVSLLSATLSANSSRVMVEGLRGFQYGHAWQILGIAQATGEVTSPAVRNSASMLPDGSAVILVGGLVESNTIYRVPLRGTPEPIALQRVNIDDVPRTLVPTEFIYGDEAPGGVREVRDVALSPDGSRIVFAWGIVEGDGAGTVELWSMDIDGTNLVRLTSGAVDTRPRISPSGEMVVFERLVGGQHDLWTTGVLAGEPAPMVESESDETQPTFGAADGTILFRRSPAGAPEASMLVQRSDNVETTLAVSEFDPSNPVYVGEVNAVFFSSKALDAQGAVVDGKRHIAVRTADQPAPRSWRSSTGTPADLMGFRCSADGSRAITVMRVEGKDYLYFEEQSLLGGNSGAVGRVTGFTSYDISGDGSRFVFAGTTEEGGPAGIWVVNWNAGKFNRITPGEENAGVQITPPATPAVSAWDADAPEEPPSLEQVSVRWGHTELHSPALSPDGTRLAVIELTEGGTVTQESSSRLVTAKLDGTDVRELATGGSILRPRWSSDGARVVFESVPDGESDFEIFTVNADGANLTRLTTNDVLDSEPTFTWDDQGVVFVRRETAGASGALLEVTLSTGAEKTLLGPEFDPAYPVAWAKAKAVLARVRSVDDTGALIEGGKGWKIAGVLDGKALPVFWTNDESAWEWPQSLRMTPGGAVYIAQFGEDRTAVGPVMLMNEAESTSKGTYVPQCIAGSDGIDISADGKTLVFFGVRDEADKDECPGIWIVDADGRNARLFSLRE